jgi:hypothetical protein
VFDVNPGLRRELLEFIWGVMSEPFFRKEGKNVHPVITENEEFKKL